MVKNALENLRFIRSDQDLLNADPRLAAWTKAAQQPSIVSEYQATKQPLKERALFAPLGVYEDDSVHLAWPEILAGPAQALVRSGDRVTTPVVAEDEFGNFLDQTGNVVRNRYTQDQQILDDASSLAQIAMLGGIAGTALKPSGAIGSFGGGRGPKEGIKNLEDELLSWFGNKQKEEASRAKKLEKGIAPVEGKSVLERAKREKVDYDIYRKMNETLGTDAVLDVLRKGEHLRPDGKGGYIGAPKVINSPQALGKMRKDLDKKFEQGVNALTLADPNRVGTWYDRAKFNQELTNEPYQLDRNLERHATYSAGQSPENELTAALKDEMFRAFGDTKSVAARKPQKERIDKAIAEGKPVPLGPKTGMYKDKNDPRIPNEGPFGVNDFRAAQTFGYTRPDGSAFQGTVSSTMHPFMDAETALMTARANERAVGGRTDWQGSHTQEVPWITGRAQDFYSRGNKGKGRYAGDELKGKLKAIVDSNNTFGDSLHKHVFNFTSERVPGPVTDHIPELKNASSAERQAYSDAAPWSIQIDPDDKYKRNAIISALKLRQIPTEAGPKNTVGIWKEGGKVENNPLELGMALVANPTGKDVLGEDVKQGLTAAIKLQAALDAQTAGAGHILNTRSGAKGKNAVLVDTRPQGEPLNGVMANGDLLAELNAILESKHGYTATASSKGIGIIPMNPSTPARKLKNVLKDVESILKREFPDANILKAKPDTIFTPGASKWQGDDLVKTPEFSGEVTQAVLEEFAKSHPDVAKNISENEGVRRVIGNIVKRDEAYPSSREDIQNMRKFFRDADWNKVVELMRQGVPIGTALAVMGYSLSALAEEPDH